MKLGRILEHFDKSKKHFIGTCVNCFDDEGDCIQQYLPYMDASDFARREEDYVQISKEQFMRAVTMDNQINIEEDAVFYMCEYDDLYILYNPNEDIHYFFV